MRRSEYIIQEEHVAFNMDGEIELRHLAFGKTPPKSKNDREPYD